MGVITLEGVVDNGQIRLVSDVHLPNNTKVYIIVPDIRVEQVARIYSPRLAQPEQASDFDMEIIEEPSGAGL
jgi:hypothetical protein